MRRRGKDTLSIDSACGAWEMLADAIHPSGSKMIAKFGWTAAGKVKHEWAEKIGPCMKLDQNSSPSFNKFREGMLALVKED